MDRRRDDITAQRERVELGVEVGGGRGWSGRAGERVGVVGGG